MSEQALDLRSAMTVVRRRARLVVAAGLVGIAAGVGFALSHPPQLMSTTLVLLPSPKVGEVSSDVATQVRIVMSASILGAAGEAVRPPIAASDMIKHVQVTAPTDQIIQIEARATRGRDAQLLSQAVAEAYVAYVRTAGKKVDATALNDLNQRKSDLEKQLSGLQTEINATTSRRDGEPLDSPSGKKDGQLLAQLRGYQADLSLQLDKVKDEIAGSTSATSSASDPTSVVQPATAPRSGSILTPLILFGVLGGFVGAMAASVWAVTRARKDPRARLRDEIADAVGSSVIGGVRSRPQKSVAGWATLLESYDAGPVDAWAFRQVLRALVPPEERSQPRRDARQIGRVDYPRSLTVVTLAGDDRALAIGPQLASFAASMGIITRLLTASGNTSGAPLWAACAADRTSDPRPGLVVGEVRADEQADLTVVLAVADRETPRLGYALHTAATLLAVSPGSVTQEELARLAVAVDDAGRFVDGIVMADPDRSDRTTGRQSIEERGRQVALPMRLTGVRSEEHLAPRRTSR